MAPVPRWFIPKGVSRPEHLPPGGVDVIKGPDDHPGTCVGGPYRPGEPCWSLTRHGWYVHLDGCRPQNLLRIAPVDGTVIAGNLPDHQWLVPCLLRPMAGGLRCALPQVLTDIGFQPPLAFQAPMEALRALVVPALIEIDQAEQDNRDPDLGFDEAASAQLAIDLLTINYHVTRVELILAGWFTDQIATRIILAAAGLIEDTPDG